MPDKRARRFRNKKQEDKPANGLVILAKRTDERQPLVQPKILQKSRADVNDSNNELLPTSQTPIKTVIVQRSVDNVNTTGSEAYYTNHIANGASCNAVTQNYPQSAQYGWVRAPADKYSEESMVMPTTSAAQPEALFDEQVAVPQMSRPTTLFSSMGILNYNARKMVQRQNTNFLVVGVIGAQGVGKSTVLNLLASDHLSDVDTASANQAQYERIFLGEDMLFATKIKTATHARTASTYMYITPNERLVLIDTPPLLHNALQKKPTSSEMYDLQNAVNLFSICHLLVVVYVDQLSIEVVRLLRLAMLMKPQQLSKLHVPNYMPNVLFVKNRAKRCDYSPSRLQRMDNILKALFHNTDLQIFRGPKALNTRPENKDAQKAPKAKLPSAEQQFLLTLPMASKECDDSKTKKTKPCVNEPVKETSPAATTLTETPVSLPLEDEQLPRQQQLLNSFLLPELSRGSANTYHGNLHELSAALRERVLATARNRMHEATQAEFNEGDWFETVTKVTQLGVEHFDTAYTDVMQQHLEFENTATTSSSSPSGTNSSNNNSIANQSVVGGPGSGNSRSRERNKERKPFRLSSKP